MSCLLFSDLDRTVLPNGLQPESSLARPLLRKLASRPWLSLVYVSGRGLKLLQEAITQYDIPVPDFAIGDVGTSIYQPSNDWQPLKDWDRLLSSSWESGTVENLIDLLADLDFLQLQEPQKQSRFKLSYYVPVKALRVAEKRVRERLSSFRTDAVVITSIDETQGLGLLDVLPGEATKLHAVRFIMEKMNIPPKRVVYCGDSGNDMPVLCSEIPAVLVANAHKDVLGEARRRVAESGLVEQLYAASGYDVLNGNYSSGVLEGAAHYLPEVREWLPSAILNAENL